MTNRTQSTPWEQHAEDNSEKIETILDSQAQIIMGIKKLAQKCDISLAQAVWFLFPDRKDSFPE